MEIFGKCLALVFSFMILGQAYLVRRYVGTWLFPACIFGLFWFGYTFVPLAVLFWVPSNPYAIAFICVCTLAFSMGSLLFDWKTAFDRNTQKSDTAVLVYGGPFIKGVFYVATLLSLIFLALNLFAQGFSIHDLFFDLYATAAAYANLRFSEDLNVGIFERLSVVFAYLGAILGGFVFPCMATKTARRFIVVLSFLPSVLVAITQSAKWHLFLCIAFFYAGLLVYRTSVGTLCLINKGRMKSTAFYAAALIAIVTISFLGRGLYTIDDNEELIGRLVQYFSSYSFGHIYAFSDWFAFFIGRPSEIVYTHESATHGFYTFAVLFKLMGSDKILPMGMFDEYSHGDLLITNVYTMFRGLIQDFGLIGTVVFMLASGFFFHLSFHAMLRNKRPVLTVAVFVLMVGYFFTSFVSSLLGVNRIYYLTFVLLWIVLQINQWITRRGGRTLPSPKPSGSVVPCFGA